MKVRLYWLVVALVSGVMAANIFQMVCGAPPNAPGARDRVRARREAAPPAGIVDERDPLAPSGEVSGPGVVQSSGGETRLGTAQAGRVARIAVAPGARVNVGDVLVELDTAVERAMLLAATAEVDASGARLRRALGGARAQELEAAEADAATAHARAELSRGVADRIAKAAASGGATEDELERARRQADADALQARAADARRKGVLAGTRREDLELARAELEAAKARRDQAAAAIERSTVRAPVAGEVLDVRYRVSEFYTPGGEPLVILGDTSRLAVRVDIDERDIAKVRVGARAKVRVNAWPGVTFTGKTVSLGHMMGSKRIRTEEPGERNDTRVLEAIVALDDAKQLIVGQRVTCWIEETK